MSDYDTLDVDYPLPDGTDPAGVEYRTRDLGRAMRRYRLDADGQLWRERCPGEEPDDPSGERVPRLTGRPRASECEWVAWSLGGTLCFYTRQRGEWRAYLARLRRGHCVHVERVGVVSRGKRHKRCSERGRRRRGRE